jgi:hypothetical protein
MTAITLILPGSRIECTDLAEAMRNATFHMVATCECESCGFERAAVERGFCDFDVTTSNDFGVHAP